MLKLDKVLDIIPNLLMFLPVYHFQMVDFTLLLFKIVVNAHILTLVRFELVLQYLMLLLKLREIALDLLNLFGNITISVFVVSDSLCKPSMIVGDLFTLSIVFLMFILQLFIILQKVIALLSKFLNLDIFVIESTLKIALLFLNFS